MISIQGNLLLEYMFNITSGSDNAVYDTFITIYQSSGEMFYSNVEDMFPMIAKVLLADSKEWMSEKGFEFQSSKVISDVTSLRYLILDIQQLVAERSNV